MFSENDALLLRWEGTTPLKVSLTIKTASNQAGWLEWQLAFVGDCESETPDGAFRVEFVLKSGPGGHAPTLIDYCEGYQASLNSSSSACRWSCATNPGRVQRILGLPEDRMERISFEDALAELDSMIDMVVRDRGQDTDSRIR